MNKGLERENVPLTEVGTSGVEVTQQLLSLFMSVLRVVILERWKVYSGLRSPLEPLRNDFGVW